MVVQSRLQRKESSYPNAKLAFHAKESLIRTTGESLRSCIFTAHQSGPCQTGRTPEDPLVQESLSSP